VLFSDAGIAVLRSDRAQVIVDAGPFGSGRAGHSHSDTLSLVVRGGAEEILADAGTFTYTGDRSWRDWFRGSAAHNVLRVNGLNQAREAGPFGWLDKPDVRLHEWLVEGESSYIDAECRYSGLRQRRRVLLLRSGLLVIVDDAETLDAAEPALLEQFWHPAQPVAAAAARVYRIGESAQIVFPDSVEVALSEGGRNGWRSPAFGLREPAPVLCATATRRLPATLAAVIEFGARLAEARLTMAGDASGLRLQYVGAYRADLHFPTTGTPQRL
jgi:hypothetical protein